MHIAHEHSETLTHAHLFCGLGGGALGFRRSRPQYKNLRGKWECLGGIDADPSAIRDFTTLTGTPGTIMDLFDEDQYRLFHNRSPDAGWKPAGPDDIRQAFSNRTPDVLFLSAPCKGFSSLLRAELRTTPRYAALNRLTIRALWLALDAYATDPVPVILFENVPGIASAAGGAFLNEIVTLLKAHGYLVQHHTHNCGELGSLAQSRRRYLIIARHPSKIAPFIYQPRSGHIQPVGPLLSRLARPDITGENSLHSVPRATLQTWLRLALIPEGGDWRDLRNLPDTGPFGSITRQRKDWHRGTLGVQNRNQPAVTIAGRNDVTNGTFAIPDPRHYGPAINNFARYGIQDRHKPSATITGMAASGTGTFSWPSPALSDTGATRFLGSVSNAPDNHPPISRKALDEICIAHITAADGTWHRPYTTAETAVLQNLVEPEDIALLQLSGNSRHAWRERIGNAVPPGAAKTVADTIGETLLLNRAGETFILSNQDIWVSPIRLALAIPDTLH